MAPHSDGCGAAMEYDQGEGARCPACLARKRAFDRARAAVVYDEHSRDLILKLKHADRTDLAALFAVLAGSLPGPDGPRWAHGWLPKLQNAARAATAADRELLASAADPIHPVRIYGELLRVLDDDAVVIGDGGDFVSYAGKYIEPKRPGGWLDPGPYGCLGTGLGYAIGARIARPDAQVTNARARGVRPVARTAASSASSSTSSCTARSALALRTSRGKAACAAVNASRTRS